MDTDNEQKYSDRARSIIMHLYSPTILAFIEQWTNAHQFKIRAQTSEHVISLDPYSSVSLDSSSSQHVAQNTRAADHIFNAAMGTDRDAQPLHKYCNICNELVARGREPSRQCMRQYLLLCSDCIIAQCSDSLTDERDHVCDYLIVCRIPVAIPSTHDLNGKWSFEFLSKMNIDFTTFEGFIAFRTFLICNVAHICPKSQPKESKSIIRANSNKKDGAPYFIIRTRVRDEIMFRKVFSLTDGMNGALPAAYCKELEEHARKIYNAEPQLIYTGAIFCPCAQGQASAGAIGPARNDVFNYWRGWHLSPELRNLDSGSIAPQLLNDIIAFIADIWAGGASCCAAMRSASVAMKGDGTYDKTRFILSWFANIIQAPERAPECQLVFRGFAAELTLPLLRFFGRSVIGAQYFVECETIAQRGETIAGVREDCLLLLADSCAMKDLAPVMRKVRGLWKARARPIKLTPVEKLARQKGIPIERDKKIIDCDCGHGRDCDRELMRVVICAQGKIPIDHERRRFCVIDYSPTPDSVINSRLRAMLEVIERPDTSGGNAVAAAMFRYLAQLSPLILHWS